MKKMRYFNGRCPFLNSRGHAYICAFSKAEAVRVGKKAFGQDFNIFQLNTYWSECWGTLAEEVLGEQTEPCAFWTYRYDRVHFFKAV